MGGEKQDTNVDRTYILDLKIAIIHNTASGTGKKVAEFETGKVLAHVKR